MLICECRLFEGLILSIRNYEALSLQTFRKLSALDQAACVDNDNLTLKSITCKLKEFKYLPLFTQLVIRYFYIFDIE